MHMTDFSYFIPEDVFFTLAQRGRGGVPLSVLFSGPLPGLALYYLPLHLSIYPPLSLFIPLYNTHLYISIFSFFSLSISVLSICLSVFICLFLFLSVCL